MHATGLVVIVLLALVLGGCELAGDIFQAGFFLGVVAVVVVIGALVVLVKKLL